MFDLSTNDWLESLTVNSNRIHKSNRENNQSRYIKDGFVGRDYYLSVFYANHWNAKSYGEPDSTIQYETSNYIGILLFYD